MRERITSEGSLSETTHHWRNYNSSGSQIGDYLSYSGETRLKVTRDVVTPNFRSLQKCGDFLPINPFEVSTTVVSRFPGTGWEGISGGSYWSGEYCPGTFSETLAAPGINTSLSDAAVLSAAGNAAASQFDALTWIGELQDSVETLAEIGRRFGRATELMAEEARNLAEIARLSKYPKRLLKYLGNPRVAWDQFSDLWLLGRYGVRPMVYDFYSVSKALEVIAKGSTLIKGSGSQTETRTLNYDSGYHSAGTTNYRWVERLEMTRKYKSKAYVRFSSPNAAAVQFNPLVTAWELTPYSFIIDWFVDIGSWVQTLSPQMRGDFLGISLSIHTIITHTCEYDETTNLPTTGGFGPAIQVKTIDAYTREPATVPLPPLLPRLSIPKLVDLATIFLNGKRKVGYILSRR